ncbi:MAG: 50S ribosomal protein L11 methyltransferase [Lachnospiraceae bacterium]|nr:50S ribosomal protein L11 methyltransferase [Lachnospiraceae bacterium]
MKWNKLTIDTTTAAVDMISYALEEMGIEGIEVMDHVPLSEEDRKTMYVDLLPDEIAPDDGTAKISFYVDEKENLEQIVLKVKEELNQIAQFLPVGTGEITFDTTEEEDWINNWKQFFKPFRLDDNIVIKPTWETLKDKKEDDLIIQIDPGTAFGTGSHETTKLCISQLKKYIKPHQTLLDVGCGSGILSIIGLKLGVEKAVGTDIDPNAIRATKENCEINQVTEEQYRPLLGNLLADEDFMDSLGDHCYDIVVANILADVIIPLSKIAGRFLKEDGVFITSGIINTKEEDVKAALEENNFEILEITRMGDWVSITGKPKAIEE